MRKRALSAIALLTIGAGCDRPNEFVPPPPPKVSVQPPSVRSVTTYAKFTGRTDAVDTVEVRARVKGFLLSVDFEPGQMVRAADPESGEEGDVLFRIEPETFIAAVKAAEARLAQSEAARDLAKVELGRAKEAFELGAASQLELDEADAKLLSTEAAVNSAQAALDQAKIDLGYTVIRAPISGRVSRELVDAGNLVGSGESTLLTTVVNDDPIYVYFDVSERDLLKYLGEGRPRDRRSQSKALLELADGNRYDHSGVVDFAETRINSGSGTLQVRATFPNTEGKLYPGLFSRILLPDETTERTLIPEVAILRDLAGSYVLVVDEDNVVQRRSITLGERVESERIVLSELGADERVIVNGIQRAIPGNPVDPQPAGGS